MQHAHRTRHDAVDPGRAVSAAAMRDRLIVALDVPTVAEAGKVVRDLGDAASFYKIGYQLAFAGGLDFARELVAGGSKVFLDMKAKSRGPAKRDPNSMPDWSGLWAPAPTRGASQVK